MLPTKLRMVRSECMSSSGAMTYLPLVRYQTRLSYRTPQGVLHFRTGGTCSSERRFGRIVRPEGLEIKKKNGPYKITKTVSSLAVLIGGGHRLCVAGTRVFV